MLWLWLWVPSKSNVYNEGIYNLLFGPAHSLPQVCAALSTVRETKSHRGGQESHVDFIKNILHRFAQGQAAPANIEILILWN